MKVKLILITLAFVSIGFADSDTNFPAWTYYGEIVEHFGLLAVAILGFIFLMPYSKKEGMNYTLSGLALLALSQLLVNMQHFMILYAGIYTALIHHGILSISIAFLIVGFHKSLASGK